MWSERGEPQCEPRLRERWVVGDRNVGGRALLLTVGLRGAWLFGGLWLLRRVYGLI